MIAFAAMITVMIMIFGIWGALVPERLLAFLPRWKTREGLWAAAALRVVCGCVFLLASPGTRWPMIFEVVGLVAIAAGLALALMGLERFSLMVTWFTGRSPRTVRALMLVVAVFGLALLWGTLPGLVETASSAPPPVTM